MKLVAIYGMDGMDTRGTRAPAGRNLLKEYDVEEQKDLGLFVYAELCKRAVSYQQQNKWLDCEGSTLTQEENLAFLLTMGDVLFTVGASGTATLGKYTIKEGQKAGTKFSSAFTSDVLLQAIINYHFPKDREKVGQMTYQEAFDAVDYTDAVFAGGKALWKTSTAAKISMTCLRNSLFKDDYDVVYECAEDA